MTALSSTIERTGSGILYWFKLAKWNLSRAVIVTRREVVDMFRDWRILLPVVVLTLIFPTIANWGAGRMLAWVERFGATIVGERLVPFLLMVVGFFPMSFSLVIALETFVGEKERRSLEPLLSTPLTDTQLYIGKTLSSTIPPLMGSLLGIAVYLAGVYFNIDWKPPAILLIQIILLTIIQSFVMVSGAVVVSSQTTSVRAANLLASFIIIPMAFLIQAEALIMFWANYSALWWIMGGLLIVDVLLVRMGVRTFNREELLGREIDELNLLASLKKLFRLILARRPAGLSRSIWQWYRQEVLGTLWRLRVEVLIITFVVVVGYFIGIRYADIYQIPSKVFFAENFDDRFRYMLAEAGFSGAGGILRVIVQNVRVLALASILAVFSFGVMAMPILMVSPTLAGFLTTQLIAAGVTPILPWAALIPHSMLEIPAAILAGALALRLGASVISPPPGQTIGEAWLAALADAVRLWFTLILPILTVAAIVEVYFTPWLVSLVVGAG